MCPSEPTREDVAATVLGRYANQEHDVARDQTIEEHNKQADIDERYEERLRDMWSRQSGGEGD